MSTCSNLGYSSHHTRSHSWFTKYTLLHGSRWQDEYVRADIAFNIITVVALLGVLVWAFTVRKRSPTSHSLFGWFTAAIIFAMINFTWNAIDSILNESMVLVERLYDIFNDVFSFFSYIAETLLLAATLTLMMFCMAVSGTSRSRKASKVTIAHLALCGVLGIFWLVILTLEIAFLVECVDDTGTSRFKIYNAAAKVNFVYDLLYLVVVLEILGWGSVLLCTSGRRSRPERRSQTVILVFIGVFLFIRQIWTTVIDGIYEFGAVRDIIHVSSDKVWFANHMFYYICTIVAFAALVAAMSRLPDDQPREIDDTQQADPIPRLAEPVEHWKRDSLRDHSQDPIWVGPEERDG